MVTATEVRPYREITNEGKYILNLHPGQTRAWESKARFPVMSAGTQSGKTCFQPDWLRREINNCGPGDYTVITATYPLLELKLLPEFIYVFETAFRLGEYNDSKKIISFHHVPGGTNGKVKIMDDTRIIFGSATHPESIESATAKASVLDECLAPETKIDTEYGKFDISEIVDKKLNLKIWSYDTSSGNWELKPILRWIKLPQRKHLLNVSGLRLTGNHKIWTKEKGYVRADNLIAFANYSIMKAEVIKDVDVRKEALRGNTPEDERIGKEAFCGLQCQSFREFEEAFSTASRTQGRHIRTAEATLCQSRKSSLGTERWRASIPSARGEGECIENNKACQTLDSWGERSASKLETGEAGGGIGMGDRVCSDNREGMVASCLQDRCCRTADEDSDRSRECRQPRQETVVCGEWLDISAFLKQNGGDLDGGLSSDSFVYNLEVEGNHNYVANSILVSNCGQRQFRLESWEATRRRLSLSRGRALFGTTLYNAGWFINEIYEPAERKEAGFELIQFDSIENPAFPREEYYEMQEKLPRWKFAMFYKGKFMRPAGLVYDSFDPAACKISRFDIPKNWLIYVGHDFGTANPAAMFYAQDLATGTFYAFHEYLPGPGRSTYEHVQEFKKITEGYNVVRRVGGNLTTEEGWRNDFTSHGWPIQPPKVDMKRVENQIESVYAMHRLNKIMVFNDLHAYLDEKMSFSYVLDEKYQPTDKLEDEPKYHLLASERTLMSYFRPETARSDKGKPIGVIQPRG